jgi:hypothetical protein
MSGSAAENFKKRSDRFLRIPEKTHEHYRTFQKKSGKVTGLFQKCLPKLSDFSKNIRQGSWSFWKKQGAKKHLPTPDPLGDFAGLFGKNPAKSSNFLKIVH